MAAPVISSLVPSVGGTDISISSNISFDLTDTTSTIDLDRLNLTLSSRPVIVSGIIQPSFLGSVDEGFSGSISAIANGYAIVINPNFNFEYSRTYHVIIDAYNIDDDQVYLEYDFTTTQGLGVLSATNEPYNNNITLTFDAAVLADSNLTNVNNYLIRGDATVVEVEFDPLFNNRVILTVDKLYGQGEFELFVRNVKNSAGFVINAARNRAVVSLGQPDTDFSGFSGALKTKNTLHNIAGDEQYWYIATAGGIDIVDRDTLLNVGYVLDGYGMQHIASDANSIYYTNSNTSDAYGVFKLAISDVGGESSIFAIEIIEEADLPSTNVRDIVASNDTVVVATEDGAAVNMNGNTFVYAQNSDISSAAIDDLAQTLYLANSTLGRIEVYYNIHLDGYGRSSPNTIYSTSTTPSIPGSIVHKLKVSSGTSVIDAGSNTLYVGTNNGVARIETNESNPGGSESTGISITYGIVDSGADHEILGGNSNMAKYVDINIDQLQLFVYTRDSDPDVSGGLSAVNLVSDVLFNFIPEEDFPATTTGIFFKVLAHTG